MIAEVEISGAVILFEDEAVLGKWVNRIRWKEVPYCGIEFSGDG